jgi:hypothetical protein
MAILVTSSMGDSASWQVTGCSTDWSSAYLDLLKKEKQFVGIKYNSGLTNRSHVLTNSTCV